MKSKNKFLMAGLATAAMVSTVGIQGVDAIELTKEPTKYTQDELYDIYSNVIVPGKEVKDYSVKNVDLPFRIDMMDSNLGLLDNVVTYGTTYNGDLHVFEKVLNYSSLITKYPTEAKLKERIDIVTNPTRNSEVIVEDFYKLGKKFYNELKPGKTVNGHTIKAANFNIRYEYKINDTNTAGHLYAYIYQNNVLLDSVLIDTFKGYEMRANDIKFTDTDNHWAKEHIDSLVNLGIVQGTTATTFSPSKNITRGQFAAMLSRTTPNVKAISRLSDRMTDVDSSAWYATDIEFLFQQGVMEGVKVNDKFSLTPTNNITRQQAAAMIVRNMEYILKLDLSKIDKNLPNFVDKDSIANYGKEPIAILYNLGVISGSTNADGTISFKPNDKLQRAQMAKMLDNVLHLTTDDLKITPTEKK